MFSYGYVRVYENDEIFLSFFMYIYINIGSRLIIMVKNSLGGLQRCPLLIGYIMPSQLPPCDKNNLKYVSDPYPTPSKLPKKNKILVHSFIFQLFKYKRDCVRQPRTVIANTQNTTPTLLSDRKDICVSKNPTEFLVYNK